MNDRNHHSNIELQ